MCQGFHTRLKDNTLHPVLRFLKDIDICWKGSSPKVHMAVRFVYNFDVPQTSWNDYINMYGFYARKLKQAVDIDKSCGLQNDLFAAPLITDLVIPASNITRKDGTSLLRVVHLHNAKGLTLKPVIDALVFGLKHNISAWKRIRHMYSPNHGYSNDKAWALHRRASVTYDFRPRFPDRDVFAAYVEGWPQSTQRLNAVADEIDKLMKGVEAWSWTEWPHHWLSTRTERKSTLFSRFFHYLH